MEPIYSRSFTLSPQDTDCFLRLKPSRLLGYLQQVAGEHSALLGTGKDALLPQGLIWAVLRHKVQITRLPLAGETIRIETWPMPTTRSAFPRSAVAYDEAGRELFRSISLWALMRVRQRDLVLPDKSGIVVNGILRGDELAVPGVQRPPALKNSALRQVQFTELDENGHMNNCRYLDWACDLLPGEFHRQHPLQGFSVRYLSEARERETVSVSWALDEDGALLLSGCREHRPEEHHRQIFSMRLVF